MVAAIVEKARAIAAVRQLAGGTDPARAQSGKLHKTQFNLVHRSEIQPGACSFQSLPALAPWCRSRRQDSSLAQGKVTRPSDVGI